MRRRNARAWPLIPTGIVLSLAACGSDSGPGAPVTVAQVIVSPSEATIAIGETQSFTAQVLDGDGGTITGRTVTWAVENGNVAAVTSAGVVTGQAVGTTKVTATVDGVKGEADLEVTLAAFTPTSNTTLSGTRTYESVEIPANVTVTVTGDLSLTSEGDVVINGTLTGDCVAVSIVADGAVTLGGVIENDCSTPSGEDPGLTIVGNGPFTIDGATMRSSGNIDLRNDPAIQEPAFGGTGLAAFQVSGALNGPFPCEIKNYTVVTGVVPAPNGMIGQHGTAGKNGSGFAFGCNGDLAFRGNVQIETQAGGNGGNGGDLASPAVASGGAGGNGGLLLIQAFGDMSFTHETTGLIANHFFAGDGGNGGQANANALPDPVPPKAPGATATGGAGGAGGGISLQVAGVLSFAPGSFYARPGFGGKGGDAYAGGADGAHAADRVGGAQEGGDAIATGGAGGEAPGFHFLALEDIVGEENIVFFDLADGGAGGKGDAFGGAGGDGDEEDIHGADGGAMVAYGGVGGDAGSGFGGAGGPAVFLQGWGGDGWSDCISLPYRPGGNGGRGGPVTGEDGKGGSGLNPGAPGGVELSFASNGGNGGDGAGPGNGGAAGTDGITANGARVEVAPSFRNGLPGFGCAPPEFDVVLIGAYRHFDGFSRVCLRIETQPPQPGASFQATVTGPGVSGNGQHQGTLNGQGVAELANDIFLFGSYVWSVLVGDESAQTTINVTGAAGSGTC